MLRKIINLLFFIKTSFPCIKWKKYQKQKLVLQDFRNVAIVIKTAKQPIGFALKTSAYLFDLNS